MKAFWDPAQLAHAPQFFLQRGVVRANYERPARAEALLAGCHALGLAVTEPPAVNRAAIETVHPPAYLDWLRDAPAQWAEHPGAGPEIIPNIHASPEMLATGARPPRSVVGQAGWFTADTACPVAPATWPSALAAAACALAAADEAARSRDSLRAVPPAGPPRLRGAGGRALLPQQRGARGRAADRARRPPGGDARHRQPPWQRHARHLLDPAGRAVSSPCTAIRRAITPGMSGTPTSRAPVPATAATATCRSPPAPAILAGWPRSMSASAPSSGSAPTRWW